MVAGVVCALLASTVALMLRARNPEIALLAAAAGAVGLLLMAMPVLSGLVEELRGLVPEGPARACFAPLLKVTGICLLARLGAELCRDAGEGAMAVKVELLGTVLALGAAMPIFGLLADILEGGL